MNLQHDINLVTIGRLALLYISLTVLGCDSGNEVVPVKPVKVDPIRKIYSHQLEHPAVWNESDYKTVVTKIEIGGDFESYDFLVTTFSPSITQLFGQTEHKSIRQDYSKAVIPGFWVTDIHSSRTSTRDPGYQWVGGRDIENIYASKGDLDEVDLPFEFTFGPTINMRNYKAQFTAMDRAREDIFSDDRNFYIAGNGYDNEGRVHPFLSTLTSSWYFFTKTWSGSINTLTFFDEFEGIEFIKLEYQYPKNIYIMGYDIENHDITIMLYKDVEVNGNDYHDDQDSYERVWLTRISDLIIDKDLINFTLLEDKLFVAGGALTKKGDKAGRLIALEQTNGNILIDSLFDYSDNDDVFFGVTTSGENIFAYGYANRQNAGDVVINCDGWAVKFSHVGKPMSNIIYAEENTTIEFTAATGGYDQSNLASEGNVAIGGCKKTGMGYKAFATQFHHTYDKDY